MAAPAWLAEAFAAVMVLTATYSASRLAFSRLRGRATELDADALHTVMGAAMAGMLVPGLRLVPGNVWTAVFGIGAAWFGWHAVCARGRVSPGLARCRHPVPHLVECAAMIYMLLLAHGPASGGAGMAMPGMGASSSSQAFPALAVILALFMLGYIVWTTDRLTARAAQRTTVPAGRGSTGGHRSLVTAGAGPGTNASASRADDQAGKPALAPTLAACTKIAMSLAMGYMLILMI
jgi:hypothetical protein